MTKYRNLFIAFILSLIVDSISHTECYAQQIIKLNDVIKLELVVREGGLMNDKRIVEVVREKKGWGCYQTRLVGLDRKAKAINDSSRRFIKRIPAKTLEQLLNIIGRRDKGINVDLFKINTAGLIRNIDSIKVNITSEQRTDFVKALRSRPVLKKAIINVLKPVMMDDRTYYGITIGTKKNISYTITAYSFANLYFLPWHIKNIECYDPAISRIFEFITGNNKFDKSEKERLYYRMDKYIYYEYFATRFNWANFKSEQPVSYTILKNTLTPDHFYINEGISHVYFKSSHLPNYVQIDAAFKQGDTTVIGRYKRYEDSVVDVFKKDNFLFNYLKNNPDYKLLMSPGKMGNVGKYFFRDIKKYYTGIDSFDYKKSQFIEIYKGRTDNSKWVLLPNNTLILLQFTGEATDSPGIKFMSYNFDLPDTLRFKHPIQVCIIFDASGKIIHNYGIADTSIY